MTLDRLCELAARARAVADEHPPGSLQRKAAACVGVALSTTRTLKAARAALADVRLPDVRRAAEERFDDLTTAKEDR